MPRGPKGEKRPADVIGTAIMVGRIATGEIPDNQKPIQSAAEAGRKGGGVRATRLSADKRRAIAKKAARARWHKQD